MAGNQVIIKFIGDATQLSATTDEVDNKVSGLTKGLAIAGGAVAGAFAVGKIANFTGDAISKASDLNETISKTGQIFGTEALPGLQAWSATASSTFGQTQTQALDAASTFAIFGKGAGLAGDDLAGFAQKNTQLASDMASFFNTSPEDAIQAIGAAFRGETEPIRRYGVLLDDASMRQKALELGITNTTKEALTPQQKVLAAQALIWDKTKDAQGDFARTSDGLANKTRAQNAQWEEMQVTIGQKLLPAKLALTEAVMKMIPLFTGLIDVISKVVTWFGEHRNVLIAVSIAILTILVPALVSWAISAGAAAVAMVVAAAPVIALGLAIAGLVLAILWVIQHFDLFKDAAVAAFNFIKDAGVAVFNWIKDNWPLLLAILTGPIGIAVLAIVKNWDTIKDAVSGVKDWIVARWDEVIGWLSGIPGRITGALSGMWDGIKSGFRGAMNWVIGAWNGLHLTLPKIDLPFGLGSFGGATFSVPQIPYLATGAFVTSPTLAMVGERGPEIVAPTDMLRKIVREESGSRGPSIQIGNIYSTEKIGPDSLQSQLSWLLKTHGVMH